MSIAQPAPSPSTRTRILLVDDDPVELDAYRRILGEERYQFTTAAGGTEAAALAREAAFDVIISDLTMPGDIDGLELLRAIRESDLDVPVILSTGGPTLDSA